MPYLGHPVLALPVLRASRRSEGQGVSAMPRSSLMNAETVAPWATNTRP